MHATRPRVVTTVAIGSLLTLFLAGCGSGGSEGAQLAGEASDKKITVYSGRSKPLVKPVLDDFQKASGVTVEVRYGDTAAMAAQLQEEGSRTPADVFLAQDAGALGAVAGQDLFAELPGEVLDKVPAAYRDDGGEWVGVTGRSRTLVYNVDQVSEEDLPESVFELTEPEWEGKVGVAPTNGSFQAFITAMRVEDGEERTQDFLEGLKANDAQIREGNAPIVADVDRGRLATGLVNHYYVYELAKEQGTTVDALKAKNHFFPNGDIGALVNVSGVGVLKGAGDDPDARAFLDYLLGKQAQTYFAQETYEYPLVAGVASAPGLPKLSSLKTPDIDLNDLDDLQTTIQMIKDSGLA
ncbi:iron ABC transporter substrate-binding protein [Streptomyces ipomoeae]|uniref:ABC transporter, substrate-binding protein n=1 Tax=Streptomyces ipomoeae 91-03 TaxID=698759 RepID=L1KWS5_9ACTN|nr:iron ABC transporter substrate-binding protein [Streptomyces ipomoeae]EKX65019.1 ABC transporter, substrate-binding protein [Streptomyces ipomoeae 91-03]MDX2692094.1 iron ABC transporter substrate-binding protein [Streptomyces ipomoeae]MDX2837469.1 iron ABC transporter substrate-binding protein [Streptomyces ipomoeae]